MASGIVEVAGMVNAKRLPLSLTDRGTGPVPRVLECLSMRGTEVQSPQALPNTSQLTIQTRLRHCSQRPVWRPKHLLYPEAS